MSEQKAVYSPEFQHFRELVKTAMFQAAADAREIAKRTGTKRVIRERPKSGAENRGEAGEHKGLESAM
jgi:hypothetical protein